MADAHSSRRRRQSDAARRIDSLFRDREEKIEEQKRGLMRAVDATHRYLSSRSAMVSAFEKVFDGMHLTHAKVSEVTGLGTDELEHALNAERRARKQREQEEQNEADQGSPSEDGEDPDRSGKTPTSSDEANDGPDLLGPERSMTDSDSPGMTVPGIGPIQ